MTATWIALGQLGFLVQHLAMSHPPVRDALVARLGVDVFRGVYSLASFAFFLPTTWLWWTDWHAGPVLWMLRGTPAAHALEAVSLLGFALIGTAVLSPPPASMTAKVRGDIEVRGILGFTRHPLSWGITLWAGSHALLNGWAGDVAYFGGLVALALVGSAHQDHRMTLQRPGYAAFREQTTWLLWPSPSAFGLLDGRAALGLGLGAGLGLAIRVLHPWLFG